MDARTDYQDIRYEVEDGRARITLAPPKTHNAITRGMLEELDRLVREQADALERLRLQVTSLQEEQRQWQGSKGGLQDDVPPHHGRPTDLG